MTITSKDEYLKAQSALATGFGPTVDFTDPQLGTTVQSEGGVPTTADELPGQVFSVDQLPNPAAAVAYGLPPVTVPEYLILDDTEDATRHVQGKDALDLINGELRKELNDPALAFDNTVRSQDDALTSFTDRTGAGLGENEGKDTTADNVAVDGVIGGDGETITTSTESTGPNVQPTDVKDAAVDKGETAETTSEKSAGKASKSG